MADDQPKIGKKKKTKAEKKRARKEKKAALKEQKRAERERRGPDYVDPAQVRPPAIEVRDIADCLLAQVEMPHPLVTSLEVMMMWFQAMNTGLPLGALRRRSGRVMQIWREEGRPGQAFTREQQELMLGRDGPDMTAPALAITWQEFQQARQLFSAQTGEQAVSLAAVPPVTVPPPAAPLAPSHFHLPALAFDPGSNVVRCLRRACGRSAWVRQSKPAATAATITDPLLA